MEPYKWYSGNELPDRECDCVVSHWGAQGIEHSLGRISKYAYMWEIITNDRDRVAQENISSYMPIEFPKEAG